MDVVLTLDDELVRKAKQVAAQRETSLAGLVEQCLRGITTNSKDEVERARARLRRSVEKYATEMRPHTWTRAELYEP